MTEHRTEIIQAQESTAALARANAAVKPYTQGGLIVAAVSSAEPSMDRIIGGHLANIAMLESRGDTVPERPLYVFNPDTRILINYALRRPKDKDPAKTGLFADVVELSEEGKPRHGVSVINPSRFYYSVTYA